MVSAGYSRGIVQPSAQESPDLNGHHVLLYDGVCGLCNRVNRFVLKRDVQQRFRFASLQRDFAARELAARGRSASALDTFYVIANYGTESEVLLDRSRAALFVAREVGWPWRAAGVFGILPTGLLNVGYNFIARIRYRTFGKLDACPVPCPEERSRFVDV